ncbi:MAG: arginine--tRNA ligase [Ferrovum myxofaciens]
MSSSPLTTSEESLEARLCALLTAAVQKISSPPTLPPVLERPRQSTHGDFASPVALQLAKGLRQPPREVAAQLIAALPSSSLIDRVELAGPGFINIFLTAQARQEVVHEILRHGPLFGSSQKGSGRRVQVEFVSSNPTGPLHVGHGRGAAYGASVANLLCKAGYQVHREYYVNDAGRQMDILTVSTWLRALQQSGKLKSLPFPNNGYQGDYVETMARETAQRFSGLVVSEESLLSTLRLPHTDDLIVIAPEEEEHHMDALIAAAKELLGPTYLALHHFVLTEQLDDCREDLEEFGVIFDEWFSEQSLFDSGAVALVVSRLENAGHLYTEKGARWFRSSAFGDEKDRVVQRENGLYTYFASDIAYHAGKFERGYDLIVDIWGADHHGYIPRVRAALKALGYDESRLSVPLVQFVSLFRQGEKAQMSTRKGQFVTLRELRTEVGRDAARLFYILRKSDQHLDFDLDLATSQSQDNPVYYIQYAHARIQRVLERWGGDPGILVNSALHPLIHEEETRILQILYAYPALLEQAAADFAPHLVAFYLRDLSAEFHAYYNQVPFLEGEPVQIHARMALLSAIGIVVRDGLSLLGVSAPDRM